MSDGCLQMNVKEPLLQAETSLSPISSARCMLGELNMNSKVMKALRFAEFGPPSVLRIEEVAIPELGEGEALVHVMAAAINPSDIANVAGRFKNTTLPRTPGRDFAGTVVKGKPGEGAEVWGSGPTLGINHDGSHAEYVVVPVEALSPKPQSLSMAQAASIGVPYITA